MNESQNGKTLSELGFLKRPEIQVRKRTIPKTSLLKDSNTLSLRAKKTVSECFERFSDHGKMDPQLCAGMISSMTHGLCNAKDPRVHEIFLKYDADKDQYLTLDDFLQLYLEASQNIPQVVWNNLNALNIRNDLRDVEEVKNEKVDISTLVRYIISSNKEYSQLLFSLLESEDLIAKKAWKIVNRLPTDPKIFSDVVLLKGIRDIEEAEKRDWNQLLDLNSKYKLLYNLQIFEYLIESSDKQESLWPYDSELVAHKKSWKEDFLAFGGFGHLSKALKLIDEEDLIKFSGLNKALTSLANNNR